MEALKKHDDCYFYYYSSCTKGESCPFRHEPSALGIETVCNFWKQGKCSKLHCNFRHMEVRKNRNVIPCYWESQPSGCRKPHCPFQHKTPREGLQSEHDGVKDLILPVSSSDAQDGNNSADRETTDLDSSVASFVSSPPVDPVVVNFEEESDNESVPSTTPVKRRNIHIKTLEEIRLERIQAESAAFYQYDDSNVDTATTPSSSTPSNTPVENSKTRESVKGRILTPEIELRKKIIARRGIQNGEQEITQKVKEPEFKVLSLQEIRERKRRKDEDEEDKEHMEEVKISNKRKLTRDTETTQISVIDRIKAIIENKMEKEVIVESVADSPRKRSHSPVVFDLGEKKVKIIEPPKKVAHLNNPPKPMVAVAGRKRPHPEENIDSVISAGADNSVSSTSSPESPQRPTRKIWRSSRQTRRLGETGSDNSNSESNITTNVFTRKLRLKKSIVQPIITSSVMNEDDNNCKKYVNNTNDNLENKSNIVPDNDNFDKSALHITTSPSPNGGDLDVDLSLLSPTNEGDISLSISKGADDILQDIDDLLND